MSRPRYLDLIDIHDGFSNTSKNIGEVSLGNLNGSTALFFHCILRKEEEKEKKKEKNICFYGKKLAIQTGKILNMFFLLLLFSFSFLSPFTMIKRLF